MRRFLPLLVGILFSAPAMAAAPPPAFIRSWGSHGSGPGQLDDPGWIAADHFGHVFVSDTGNNRIEKFDTTGVFLGAWGSLGSGDAQLNDPRGLATDEAGNVYVCDAWNNRVQVFDGDGNFIRQLGSAGNFEIPTGVALSGGTVFIVDTNGLHSMGSDGILHTLVPSLRHAGLWYAGDVAVALDGRVCVPIDYFVDVYDQSGNYQFSMGDDGEGHPGFLTQPQGVTVDSEGILYLAFRSEFTAVAPVATFNSAYARQGEFGAFGCGDGQFQYAHDVAVDPAGHIFVVDSQCNQIQEYGPIPVATRPGTWGAVKALYR